jgi:hypothetical protein
MLLFPHSDTDFSLAGLGYFVGCFGDLYDREDLEEYLNRFDPNSPVQLKLLLDEFFFPIENRELTIQHKIVLVNMLKDNLLNTETDFASVFEEKEDYYIRYPDEWHIHDARAIFKHIYRFLLEEWCDELSAAGYDVVPFDQIV